jgi:hypothetical protein
LSNKLGESKQTALPRRKQSDESSRRKTSSGASTQGVSTQGVSTQDDLRIIKNAIIERITAVVTIDWS